MTRRRRRRSRESPRRYGEDDNVPRQGATGIGIVTALSLLLSLVAFALAAAIALVL